MEHYIYGCARVSTQQQELIRQLDLLEKYKCTEIVTKKRLEQNRIGQS